MFYSHAPSKESSRKLASHHIGIINVFIIVITALLYISPAKAESSSNSDSLKPLNRFPRMVQEYLVKSVRRIENRANEQRTGLKTKADAESYIRDVQEKIQQDRKSVV